MIIDSYSRWYEDAVSLSAFVAVLDFYNVVSLPQPIPSRPPHNELSLLLETRLACELRMPTVPGCRAMPRRTAFAFNAKYLDTSWPRGRVRIG